MAEPVAATSVGTKPVTALPSEPAKSVKPARKPITFQFGNDASLTFYGRTELVTYYDTAGVAVSDWMAWTLPSGTYDGDEDSFSMSVRASKIGTLFNWDKVLGGGDIEAKVEADFVGGFSKGGNSVYSPLLRLKQAYVEGSWGDPKTGRIKALFGQSFGVFDPMLFPNIDSWIAMATSGNPWIRLPQIRVSADYAPFSLQVSVNRSMGADEVGGGSVDDHISWGEQSNIPLFMARFGVKHDFGNLLVQAGVGGVFGREKVHIDESDDGPEINSTHNMWMASADLLISAPWFDIKGEFFMGQDLNTLFAGINQGVSIGDGSVIPIRTIGGWGQLGIKPTPEVRINLGAGIDDPYDSDLILGTQRSQNITAFLGASYTHASGFGVSAETSWMKTSYLENALTNENWRFSTKVFFAF